MARDRNQGNTACTTTILQQLPFTTVALKKKSSLKNILFNFFFATDFGWYVAFTNYNQTNELARSVGSGPGSVLV